MKRLNASKSLICRAFIPESPVTRTSGLAVSRRALACLEGERMLQHGLIDPVAGQLAQQHAPRLAAHLVAGDVDGGERGAHVAGEIEIAIAGDRDVAGHVETKFE